MRRLLPALATAFLLACGPAQQPTGAPATAAPRASAAPSASAQAASAAPPATASSAAASPAAGVPCGELDCRIFDTPEAAFAAVLAEKPAVLGIGEAHAQKGSEGVPSATHRFAEKLLPVLDGKASDIVLEIWVAEGKCGKEKEQKVAEQQKPVTQNQAQSNQNEYVGLGDAAFKLHIQPRILRASCADYDAILKAGPDAVIVMLEMIGRLMGQQALAAYERNAATPEPKLVLTYGGALHNDLSPRAGRESWSFGPKLAQATHDRYVELDLIVPEYIQDTDAWKSMPWYPHFNRDAHPDKTTLFRTAKGSYVLIFPRS
jgi:hypothetical protein